MTLLWFRRDLRDSNHPLLSIEGKVMPIFIFDTIILSKLAKNDKRVPLIFALIQRLKIRLRSKGLDLAVFYGNPIDIIRYLKKIGFNKVIAAGDYDSYAKDRDNAIGKIIDFHYIHDTYLFRPDEILKDDGSYYHVFTPYYNKVKKVFTQEHILKLPNATQILAKWDYDGFYKINEERAIKYEFKLEVIGFNKITLANNLLMEPDELLSIFKPKICSYAKQRDYLDRKATSSLSIALRFGTIGIREVARKLVSWEEDGLDTEPFFRQLIWREFYASLLNAYQKLETENYKTIITPEYDLERFESFCTAKTGVPIVDAAITELVTTGRMHNRARMIVASFFVKDLLLPWQWGEAFFAKHLLDYDAASNILSWQWSAGTGIDPQPFFRIFNPYIQTSKFDPNGIYIKKYLPFLEKIDPKIFTNELALHTVSLPDYPTPIVKHSLAVGKAKARFNLQGKQTTNSTV